MDKKLGWHWDPSRKCFYEGALADQRWCLPENIVDVVRRESAVEAFEEAAKEVPTSWVDSLLSGKESPSLPWNCPQIEWFSSKLKERILSRAAALRAGAKEGN